MIVVIIGDVHLHPRQRTAVGVEGLLWRIIKLRRSHRAVLGHSPRGHDIRVQYLCGAFDENTGDWRAGREKNTQA